MNRLFLSCALVGTLACSDATPPFLSLSSDALVVAAPLHEELAAIVEAGPPAAAMWIRDQGIAFSAAGKADLRTGRAPLPFDRFRIASVTKPFVAVVMLQLAEEGALSLDDQVSDYLPELLPASMPVTVRQLLQHTSGLADYHDYDGLDTAAAYIERRFEDPSAEESLALALPHSPLFTPGSDRHYTDTNYRVLELLVPAITGHSIADEIRARILRPLHLFATSYPEADANLRGPHLHGYMATDLPDQPFGNQAELADLTIETLDQTGAAGALISNGPDLIRFWRALLTGKLLTPASLAAMKQVVAPAPDEAAIGSTGYGLGLTQLDFGCGTFWGHAGSIRGYTTLTFAREDASRVVVLAVTQSVLPDASLEPILTAAAKAACPSP